MRKKYHLLTFIILFFTINLSFAQPIELKELLLQVDTSLNNINTVTYKVNYFNPLGVIICSKINGLDIGQDTEFQYLEVTKQTNIYVKYSKKLF